jgi:hypothetical protein
MGLRGNIDSFHDPNSCFPMTGCAWDSKTNQSDPIPVDLILRDSCHYFNGFNAG